MPPYTAPGYKTDSFNCPFCGAFSHQTWYDTFRNTGGFEDTNLLDLAYCAHCNRFSVWYDGKMIIPTTGSAPLPNPDLPTEIKPDYDEARSICGPSPRGAAALLRLVIQKLCKHLGQNGVDLNADIANLVNQGLSPKIQKALDVVRVIGNEAVHPGQIDLNDNPEMASKLFVLVNLIVDAMITQPKQINDLYRSLPESKRKAIDARDSATPRK